MAAKNVLTQLNIVEVAALTDSGTAFIGFGAKVDGLYIKNGVAAEARLVTTNDIGVSVAFHGHSHLEYQSLLSGTGFVKISGTTISYDPSIYLSTKSGVEAVLIGQISSHYHDLSGYATIGHIHPGYLTSQISHADVLVDGDFTSPGIMLRGASAGAYSILANNSANWNTAYGWGNHAGLYSLLAHTHSGYQATLSGTGLVKSTSGVISYDPNIYVTGTPWTGMGYVTGTPWTGMGYLTSQTSHADVLVDGDFTSPGIMLRGASAGAYSILTDNSVNWNTAYGWGNHAGLYSLLAHTHSGYQATLSGTGLVKSTAGVISYDPNTYVTGTPWTGMGYVTGTPWTGMGYVTGTPWTGMGYLTSQTSHADVLVDGDFASQGIMLRGASSGAYSILADNSANWNTAYGWGNHAGLYSLLAHTHSGYQAALSGTGLVKSTAGVISYDTNTYVTGTPWTGMGYLTSQTSHADVLVDGDFASPGIMLRGASAGAYSILTDNSANWNTAYGWGNHAGLYSLLAHTHSAYEPVLGNPSLSGYVLSSTTAGVRSWVLQSGGSAYSLPLAANGIRGGVQLGYSNYYGNIGITLFGEKLICELTSSTIDYAFVGDNITNHKHNSHHALKAGVSTQAFATAALTASGNIVTTGSYNIEGNEVYRRSSRTLKHNIKDLTESAIDILNNTKICTYQMIADDSFSLGFIAEDTHEWLSSESKTKHVFGNHLGILTKAIQEEDEKVVELQKRILELQNQVKELQNGR